MSPPRSPTFRPKSPKSLQNSLMSHRVKSPVYDTNAGLYTHCTVCCSVLQCVAVCCSVLQCIAVCCNVLQCAREPHICYKCVFAFEFVLLWLWICGCEGVFVSACFGILYCPISKLKATPSVTTKNCHEFSEINSTKTID